MLKKAAGYLATFFIIITINFFIPRLMPGDPFTFLSSEEGQVIITYSEEQIEKYKAYYGLDKPLLVQYANYLTKLLAGDIGYSIYYNGSVISVLGKRMLWTMSIVAAAIFVSFLSGTLLGCVSAWRRKGLLDQLLYGMMIALSEIPAFLIGVVFLFLLSARLGLFPLSGGMTTFAGYGNFLEQVKDIVHHAALPVLTLSMVRLGEFYLISRSSMMTVLAKDYMRTARAKGLAGGRILFVHALKNAIPPVVTRVFLSLGAVFGGAVLVENVFNYPGVGRLMREAVLVRDYVLLQGIFLLMAVTVLTMNLLADVVNRRLDPRLAEGDVRANAG